jgi:5-methylthioadenosine/S-adenosylhomocysteine deaminase
VEPAGALEEHAIAVRGGAIEALLPASEASGRYADLERVELPHHLVIPGLVNAHASAATGLAGGDATLLACAEMLAGGITCFADSYLSPESALEAAHAAGIRAAHGILAAEHPSAYASDFDDYLRKGLALRDRTREDPLASFFLAPLAADALSDAQLRHVAALAAELDLPVHLRLHETPGEIERCVARHGVRPIERLEKLGLLGPNLAAVHGVHLAPREIELLARHGCSVVHCPSSDLGLARGFAPVAAIVQAGVNLALGTASAEACPRLDLFQEMRTAALLARAAARDAVALPAGAALSAATLGSARALGLEKSIGSIARGKCADLVAIDMRAPGLLPPGDPLPRIVHAAGRENVSQVWVSGRLVFAEGKLQNPPLGTLDTRRGLWENSKARAGS